MAISTPTLLGSASNNTSATQIGSSSFSPANDSLLFFAARCDNDVTAQTITVANTGLTNVGAWTTTMVYSGTAAGGTLIVGVAKITGSGGTGTVTVAWGVSQPGRVIEVIGLTGHSTTASLTLKAGAGSTTGTTYSLTLDSSPAYGSTVLAALASQRAAASVTPGASFTEVSEIVIGTQRNLETEYDQLNASTTVDWSGLVNGNGRVGIALEVPAAPLSAALTGTSASTGSLDVNETQAAAATGSGSSSGSLAVGLTLPVALSGSSTSSGSLTVNETQSVQATGTGTSSGSVDLSLTEAVAATGSSTSSGTLDVSEALAVSVTGTSSSDGTLEVSQTNAVELAGSSSSDGSLDVNVVASIEVIGAGASDGTIDVDLKVTHQVAATGAGTSSGSIGVHVIMAAPPIVCTHTDLTEATVDASFSVATVTQVFTSCTVTTTLSTPTCSGELSVAEAVTQLEEC